MGGAAHSQLLGRPQCGAVNLAATLQVAYQGLVAPAMNGVQAGTRVFT